MNTFLGVTIIFWLILNLFNYIMNKFVGTKYQSYLNDLGISISLLKVSWTKTTQNGRALTIGDESLEIEPKQSLVNLRKLKCCSKIWFFLGSMCTQIVVVVSLCLLTYILAQAMIVVLYKSPGSQSDHIIQPLIPGSKTFPWSHLTYLSISMLISVGFHEFGHALAAISWGLEVEEIGFFLILFIPGAYVKLDQVNFAKLKPNIKLCIASGGVWHNLVLALIAWFVISSSTFIYCIGYIQNEGVIVESVHQASPLSGLKGLTPGAIVSSINGCPVRNRNSWVKCLLQATEGPLIGYCINTKHLPISMESCCIVDNSSHNNIDADTKSSETHLCYAFTQKLTSLSISDLILNSTPFKYHSPVCLGARWVASQFPLCNTNDDCYLSAMGDVVCAQPYHYPASGLRLYQINQINHHTVLYEAKDHLEFFKSVRVREWIPKTWLLPAALPEAWRLFWSYTMSLNLALALFNATPFYLVLDGRTIVEAAFSVWEERLSRWENKIFIASHLLRSRNCLLKALMLTGTFLLITNVVLAYARAFK